MAAMGQQFPFVERAAEFGAASLAPMLPLTLVATRNVAVPGLLDTGASVNVLPYAIGVELGFDWDQPSWSLTPAFSGLVVSSRFDPLNDRRCRLSSAANKYRLPS